MVQDGAPVGRRTTAAAGLAAATLAMVLGGTVQAAATSQGEVIQAGRHVPGGYVVSLKDGVRATSSPQAIEQAAASLAEKYGGTLKSTFTASIQGFAVRGMSGQDARRLAADPSVRAVFEDGTATAAETQDNATWGIDRGRPARPAAGQEVHLRQHRAGHHHLHPHPLGPLTRPPGHELGRAELVSWWPSSAVSCSRPVRRSSAVSSRGRRRDLSRPLPRWRRRHSRRAL